VLFLDRSNDLLGPTALAIARKAFPDHGVYATAGTEPASSISKRCANLLSRLGHESAGLQPTATTSLESWADYKVIVCLEPETAKVIEPAPFNTVVVTWWELPQVTEDDKSLEDLYRVLSGYVSSLMTTLRGEDFS